MGGFKFDTTTSSNDDLVKAMEAIQQTLEARKEPDEDLVGFHFQHMEQNLQGELVDKLDAEHVDLSMDHLELYRAYLQRLSLGEGSSLLPQHQKLLAKVKAAIEVHPLYGTARSGDVEGDEHKSASILKTPTGRRRQTAAVLWLSLLTGPMINFIVIFLLCVYIPYFIYLFLAYMTWVVYDARTAPRPAFSRRSDKWRNNAVFRHFRDYFPIRLVKHDTANEMDPSKNYLFCYHPHGIISAGVLGVASAANGFDEMFKGITLSVNTLAVNWYMPVIHEHAGAFSYGDASKKCLMKTLSSGPGFSSLLVTGGAQESMMAHPYSSKVVLKTRAGFVKIALRSGASLVPIWAFGENNIFENLAVGSAAIQNLQRKIQKILTFAPVMVAGRGVFSYSGGILPHRRPITVVFGAPIAVEQDPEPSPEKVQKVHEQYKAAVLLLFNSLKDIYDPRAEPIQYI